MGDVPCEHDAYQRAARSGYPATLGAELGWRCHRPHLPSSIPLSQEVSTVPGPPEKSQTQKSEGHRRGRSQTKHSLDKPELIQVQFKQRWNECEGSVSSRLRKKRNIRVCIINDNTCVQCFFLKLSRGTPEFWRRFFHKSNCYA